MNLKEKLLPNRVIFFNPINSDFISNLIIEAQKIRNPSSRFSHIGFIGDDGLFYESTVTFSLLKFSWHDGIKITSIDKRFKNLKDDYDEIGIQSVVITNEQWKAITKNGQTKEKEKLHYAFFELIGTLITLVRWKLTINPDKKKAILREKNPFDTNAVYCIAFVADCFKEAGLNYISSDIDTSETIVDDGWDTTLIHSNELVLVP